MAWTPGANLITGDLVTAAVWNALLGAAGSLEYLQSWQQNDVTGTRDILATVYQNTDDFIRIVTISCIYKISDNGAGDIASVCGLTVHVENANPPTIQVLKHAYNINFNTGNFQNTDFFQAEAQVTFVVLPGFYYKATKNDGIDGTVTLVDWFEWGPA